jgi:hypothetical protein
VGAKFISPWPKKAMFGWIFFYILFSLLQSMVILLAEMKKNKKLRGKKMEGN